MVPTSKGFSEGPEPGPSRAGAARPGGPEVRAVGAAEEGRGDRAGSGPVGRRGTGGGHFGGAAAEGGKAARTSAVDELWNEYFYILRIVFLFFLVGTNGCGGVWSTLW